MKMTSVEIHMKIKKAAALNQSQLRNIEVFDAYLLRTG